MQLKIILTTFLSTIASIALAQEMSFEEYNPKSTLVVPENPVASAKFKFIDVHSHQSRMATQDLSLLIKDMDKLNEGIMVNLSGGSGASLRAKLKNVNENYPNRFAIFANVDYSGVGNKGWGEQAAKQLEADVKAGAKGLKVFKSLGLRNKDINGNRIAVDDPRLDPVWAKCGELGIPVLIHAADPKPFWDDTGLLDEMPNMSVGIGAIIAELGRQPKQAKAFFIKYQDRILFGKDSWKPEEFPTYFRVLETDDEYFPYYKKYHAFWAMYGLDLPDDVLQKVYYKNALNLIPGLDKSLFN